MAKGDPFLSALILFVGSYGADTSGDIGWDEFPRKVSRLGPPKPLAPLCLPLLYAVEAPRSLTLTGILKLAYNHQINPFKIIRRRGFSLLFDGQVRLELPSIHRTFRPSLLEESKSLIRSDVAFGSPEPWCKAILDDSLSASKSDSRWCHVQCLGPRAVVVE